MLKVHRILSRALTIAVRRGRILDIARARPSSLAGRTSVNLETGRCGRGSRSSGQNGSTAAAIRTPAERSGIARRAGRTARNTGTRATAGQPVRSALTAAASARARRTARATPTSARSAPAAASSFGNARARAGSRSSALRPFCPSYARTRSSRPRNGWKAGDRWTDHDLVFTTKLGGPIERMEDWKQWKAILKQAGVRDARVHDARHTAATLLIEQGVHIRVVQEILGHTRVTTTERYTHVATLQMKDASERMGAALWGSP
ncbi:tyrosine-type recombinase/integrase [Nonomuraea wenchangensis]